MKLSHFYMHIFKLLTVPHELLFMWHCLQFKYILVMFQQELPQRLIGLPCNRCYSTEQSARWPTGSGDRIDVPKIKQPYINDSVQDCNNSIALAMELLQSCTKPSICLQFYVQCLRYDSCYNFIKNIKLHVHFILWYLPTWVLLNGLLENLLVLSWSTTLSWNGKWDTLLLNFLGFSIIGGIRQ